MDKSITISLFFLFLGLTCYGQQIEEQWLWEPSKRLTWKDFRGALPPDAYAAATTASGISYKYSANLMHHEVILDFEVNAYFYPTESWYNPLLADDTVLVHEQLHFDITELFARILRKRLELTSFSDNVKAEIRAIYQKILKDLADFQEKYDWETNFSRNKEAQLRWNEEIKEDLQNAQ